MSCPHCARHPESSRRIGADNESGKLAVRSLLSMIAGVEGESNAISEDYVICGDLRAGYSRAWVAANAPMLPGLANLGAGSLSSHQRQFLVNAAWVDLLAQEADSSDTPLKRGATCR